MFSKATAYAIGLQLLDLLERLHALGFVHNDLKLENLVVGNQDSNKIYLIDFGLAKSIINRQTGEFIEQKQLYKFNGNFHFASINSCRGYNKSRRDDIESLLYIVTQLVNIQPLPWCLIKP